MKKTGYHCNNNHDVLNHERNDDGDDESDCLSGEMMNGENEMNGVRLNDVMTNGDRLNCATMNGDHLNDVMTNGVRLNCATMNGDGGYNLRLRNGVHRIFRCLNYFVNSSEINTPFNRHL